MCDVKQESLANARYVILRISTQQQRMYEGSA